MYLTSSSGTLSGWMWERLCAYALPTVKQSTYVSYESYARLHIDPAIGRYKLSTLKVEQFQKFFNQKNIQNNSENGLSEKSLCNLYNMLHICLDQAVVNGKLNRNPVVGVKLPPVPKHNMRILNKMEQAALQVAASESRILTAFGIF